MFGALPTELGSQILSKQAKEKPTMRVKGRLLVVTTVLKDDRCVLKKKQKKPMPLTLDSSPE